MHVIKPLSFLPMVLLLLALVSACQPVEALVPPTQTLVPTQIPTPTIVWFPPTQTPTPFPTIAYTPTADLRPGLGEIFLEDDFSDGEAWSLAASDVGSAAVANDHLTLSLRQPKAYLFTTRQEPFLTDFYVEVTANTKLCSSADEYGLLLRVLSSGDFYRFALSCDGRAKVERLFKGLPGSMVPWTDNGVIPAAAPGVSRLGVWAAGEQLRFFVNDQFLFSVRDSVLYRGLLGLFVRSAGENAVTVTFSDLVIHRLTP